jgi:hypothetical protein
VLIARAIVCRNREKYAALGLSPVGSSPTEFKSFLAEQVRAYTELVKIAQDRTSVSVFHSPQGGDATDAEKRKKGNSRIARAILTTEEAFMPRILPLAITFAALAKSTDPRRGGAALLK